MAFGGYQDESGGARAELVARIAEIKAAPHHGQKRLVVRGEGQSLSHAVIDIDIAEASALKEKETYRFQVAEKNLSRPGQSGMQRQSGFKNYYCDDTPEKYEGERTQMDRFGESGHFKNTNTTRTKF